MTKYKKQIVAFFDILGFKEIIKKVGENEQEAIKVIKHLQDSIEKAIESNLNHKISPDEEPLATDSKYKIFSDCICINADCISGQTAELASNNVFTFLLTLIYIQAELMLKGIFIRGAVSIDNHYSNDEIIFSAALVKSYNLESKDAIYPRILIDETVISFLQYHDHEGDFEILNSIIKRDVDGHSFLDYLEYVSELDYDIEAMEVLVKHKDIIEKNLKSEHPATVKEKYLWAARYHNQKCEELGKDFFIDKSLISFSNSIFTHPICYLFGVQFLNKKKEWLFFVYADSFYEATQKIKKDLNKNQERYKCNFHFGIFSKTDIPEKNEANDETGIIFLN